MKISFNLYKKIVDVMPILCVDIVILQKGKFLLVKRKRHPVKGKWWPPGGRVLKGETIEEAVKRKAKEELSIEVKPLRPLGYYERHFKENEFSLKSGIHTVSIVFLAKPLSLKVKLDNQSSGWRFSKNLPRAFKNNIKPFYSKI